MSSFIEEAMKADGAVLQKIELSKTTKGACSEIKKLHDEGQKLSAEASGLLAGDADLSKAGERLTAIRCRQELIGARLNRSVDAAHQALVEDLTKAVEDYSRRTQEQHKVVVLERHKSRELLKALFGRRGQTHAAATMGSETAASRAAIRKYTELSGATSALEILRRNVDAARTGLGRRTAWDGPDPDYRRNASLVLHMLAGSPLIEAKTQAVGSQIRNIGNAPAR